jgi:hypothetical protein
MRRFASLSQVWIAASLTTFLIIAVCSCWRQTSEVRPRVVPSSDGQTARGRLHFERTNRPDVDLVDSPGEDPLKAASGDIVLTDVLSETGIGFVHTDGSSGEYFLMETMSAGLATFDYDGDGLIDIYFLNGAPLPKRSGQASPGNRLYRNLGGWKFLDVTQAARVGDTQFALGVTTGDFNNDGYSDIYVNNFGPNVLYRNNGDGTFSDITQLAGVDNGEQVGAGTSLLDIEGDGDLDLYVSNYIQFSYEAHVPKILRGIRFYPGPLDHQPAVDKLYRNNGDSTFRDVTRAAGIAAHAGTGMGITAADYDHDGDTDIFVANDEMPNALFENDGGGNFREVAALSGVAYDMTGVPQASMGVDSGDFDNDGKLDFYVTSYDNEFASLYRNLDQGFFHDVTRQTGAARGTWANVTWGIGFVDFDQDGDRDIFVACGHTEDNIAQLRTNTSHGARNLLLMNTGPPYQFLNVTNTSGTGMLPRQASRGAAFDDLDNDGDVDVVILNSRTSPSILRNDSANDHNWLQVRLVGTTANREAVGARVTVVRGDLELIDEVHSGRGYQSQWGNRLHFGLGSHPRIDEVRVEWLGSGMTKLTNVATNQLLTIVQPARSSSKQQEGFQYP